MKDEETLSALFEPKTIAVVGASSSPDKAGHAMLRSLRSFPGSLFPVNPRATEIEGLPAFSSISEIPETVDLAVLVLPPQNVPQALGSCAEAGVRTAVICSGGMGESGAEGVALQNEALSVAREAGMRVLGPNTSGYVNPSASVYASFVPGVTDIQPGEIAIVAQSGGVNHALSFQAQSEGLGVRLAVGLGNAMDVDTADMLNYLAEDEATRVILLHLEGIPGGRKLFEAVGRAVECKPVIALKVGRSDVGDFARSHTGALTGSWRLARAALAQAGAVIVEDTVELIDAAHALAATRLPPTAQPGIGLVSGQAGPALLVADALRTAGIELPELEPRTSERLEELLPPVTYQRNPVDTGRPDESFVDVLTTVGEDSAIDALVVYALHEPGALEPVATMKEFQSRDRVPSIFITAGPQKKVAQTATSLKSESVPVYLSPERGARAMRALVMDARSAYRRKYNELPRKFTPSPLGPEPLDEAAAKDLLEASGIRAPRRRVCVTHDEARIAWSEFEEQVVVKVLDSTVTHKSEANGVHVGVDSPEALRNALNAIDELSSDGGARYLIEELASPGVELIIGGTRDPSFGPTVLLGIGGTAAEAIGDVALRLAPLSVGEAEVMIEELSGKKLLKGFRGQPTVDRGELIDALLVVSHMLTAHPEIVELDINPIRATDKGLVALDALILLASQK